VTVLTDGEKRAPTPTAVGPFGHWHGIVGASRALTHVLRRIELVSAARSTVLITGETGTGKELVARAIHGASARHGMPFVTVNCAAIPATLIKSELFGHIRGAFTGAASNRKGKFLSANGGTIFLDEIDSMGTDLQSKLLRVLQEREIEALGAVRTVPIDVRVVAATNRDLRQLVDRTDPPGSGPRPIDVPPLRERLEDLLVDHFVSRHAAQSGKHIEAVEGASSNCLSRTTGLGTCESSRTPSSARSC
jgi:transcriptional regulator with GAF, ATPase, and Fis domain